MPLRELFISLSDHRFVFVEPGGNWGDHLIYLGAHQLAAETGVQYRTLVWDQFLEHGAHPDEVIYLHGSGGFVSTSSQRAPRILQKALNTSGATVIQGPCTLADANALDGVNFDAMPCDRLYFFTREAQSQALAAARLPSVFLNPDTALYLTRSMLLRMAGYDMPDRIPRRSVRLLAIRTDPEAAVGRMGWTPGVWDAVIDPARYAQSFNHWIRIHAASKSILTDRTHSAIIGAILGIPTTMFAGAYHKNRSIWEYSLEARGVRWLEADADVPTRPAVDPLLAYLPVAAQQSWKLDRLAKRVRGVPLH